jgi:hypothetical protein
MGTILNFRVGVVSAAFCIVMLVACSSSDDSGGSGGICPLSYPGCSAKNLCSTCHSTCGYCQDLNESTCGADDCMTCAAGRELHVIWTDGTGECLLK